MKKAEYDLNESGIEILAKLGQSVDDIKDSRHHWLVDKIYSQALVMVQNYQCEGTRVDAVTKYLYGIFLSGIDERLRESVLFLENALEISHCVDECMHPLFNLVSMELSKSLIKLSERVRSEIPAKALEK